MGRKKKERRIGWGVFYDPPKIDDFEELEEIMRAKPFFSYKKNVKGLMELTRAHKFDAGLDLRAAKTFEVGPYVVKVDTGVCIKVPAGYMGLIVLRSSWSASGLMMPSPGIIDCGFTGEIRVPVFAPWEKITIGKNKRFAQIIFCKIITPMPDLNPDAFSKYQTQRGDGGFGSTGDAPDFVGYPAEKE